MDGVTAMLVIVVLLAIAFDYVNGFHDTANAIATSVATRALSPRTAILMATAFNFIGAFAGTAVAKTIGSGLVDEQTTTLVVVAAALIGAIIWNLITWWLGLPSSSSHALIGGLLGATIIAAGTQALNVPGIWNKVIVPMFTSPLFGFAIAFALMIALYWAFQRSKRKPMAVRFRKLQVVSAAFMAFAHGSNDAQKTMGIITLALLLGRVDLRVRRPDVGHHRVRDRALPRDGGRRLADHAHDGPARREAGTGPRLRRRDHGGLDPARHRRTRDAGLDDPGHLERDHGRRVQPGRPPRPLGRRAADPHRLGPDHPGRRPDRGQCLGRPERDRPVMTITHRPTIPTAHALEASR